jgi:rare lipoprotein A (peptidoglycan hydrolase)
MVTRSRFSRKSEELATTACQTDRVTWRFAASARLALGTLALLVASYIGGCSSGNPTPQPALVAVPQPVIQAPPKLPPETHVVKASYYGNELKGAPTASGEPYDPDDMTAASKKYPIGTRVRVTNPDNGRSVIVRINDRGPYVHGRGMDLSAAAARKLGITHAGVKRLKITKLSSKAKAETASAPAESGGEASASPEQPN